MYSIGRPAALVASLSILLLAAACVPSSAPAAECRGADLAAKQLRVSEAQSALLCLINKERHGHGLKPLKLQEQQTKAAQSHTRLMIKKRCFSHQCPGERDLTGRLVQTSYLPCNCSWGIAENIAYGSGSHASPRRIADAWMGSGGHRATILNRSYQHIGIGVAWGTPAAGRDRDSATYTAVFGFRR